MPTKVSEARARERVRLRDIASEFSDAILDDLRLASLRAIAREVLKVWPDYYLTRRLYNLYTDAADPGTWEFYRLPTDFAALRWVERADGTWHPKLTRLSPSKQELARFAGPLIGTIDFLNGSATVPIPLTGSMLSYSVQADKLRIIPAPQAAGMQITLVYDRQPAKPESADELLDIPPEYEEACALDVAARVLEIDGDPAQGQVLGKRAASEVVSANSAFFMRAATEMLYTAT